MASSKRPLVLLHPFLVSGTVWQDVAPLLSRYHQVFTPTLLGHSGGPRVQRRPATIWDVIDAAEAYLDEIGLQRPHLAGNSQVDSWPSSWPAAVRLHMLQPAAKCTSSRRCLGSPCSPGRSARWSSSRQSCVGESTRAGRP
jgi:hypothetical protein